MAKKRNPQHLLFIDGEVHTSEDNPEPAEHAEQIRSWLASLLATEHLSLLVGSGLSLALAAVANVADKLDMGLVAFASAHHEKVDAHAAASAEAAARGEPNIEDQLRAALQLAGGLRILGDDKAADWEQEIGKVLGAFAGNLLGVERGLADAVWEGDPSPGELMVGFLMAFASRPPSKERLQVFTTNYDRVLEYACDLAGIRSIDRFVGSLAPVFRASRLDVDLHYNPPGIRGEPRFLDGVVRLSKLHGSVDWRYDDQMLRREPLPFGADRNIFKQSLEDPYGSLMIYPNPAKDVATLDYPYAELFRDFSAALCRPNAALVTYGYGFGDDHVNRVIADMLHIPSTQLVVIAYGDPGGRITAWLGRHCSPEQRTVLMGPNFGDLPSLVRHYLPSTSLDLVHARRAERARLLSESNGVAKSTQDEMEGGVEAQTGETAYGKPGKE